MSYQTEFPDFDVATMPAVPGDWVDRSWRNDSCPCFETPSGLQVFVDYDESALREFPEIARFSVSSVNDDEIVDLYHGDDWNAALEAVALHGVAA